MVRLLIGLVCSGVIAVIAFRKQSLSTSGAVAAVLVGTVLFWVGDLFWYGLLLIFFLSSTGWSRFKRAAKREVENQFAKGGRRDALQVLANGGAALICAIMYTLFGDVMWLFGFLGSLAAVTADTWATELGVLSAARPRHILQGRGVAPGTSGGVTWFGSLAALLGAALITVCGYVLWPLESHTVSWWYFMLAGTVAGVIGSFVDSLLGATLQRQYVCFECGLTVERPQHCGRNTKAVKGWRWMTNDTVNVLGSLAGAITFILLAVI